MNRRNALLAGLSLPVLNTRLALALPENPTRPPVEPPLQFHYGNTDLSLEAWLQQMFFAAGDSTLTTLGRSLLDYRVFGRQLDFQSGRVMHGLMEAFLATPDGRVGHHQLILSSRSVGLEWGSSRIDCVYSYFYPRTLPYRSALVYVEATPYPLELKEARESGKTYRNCRLMQLRYCGSVECSRHDGKGPLEAGTTDQVHVSWYAHPSIIPNGWIPFSEELSQ